VLTVQSLPLPPTQRCIAEINWVIWRMNWKIRCLDQTLLAHARTHAQWSPVTSLAVRAPASPTTVLLNFLSLKFTTDQASNQMFQKRNSQISTKFNYINTHIVYNLPHVFDFTLKVMFSRHFKTITRRNQEYGVVSRLAQCPIHQSWRECNLSKADRRHKDED
jgi:hypothetical protein